MNKLSSAQMLGGNSSTGRETRDAYNTPPNVTGALLDFLELNPTIKIWEPAAGIGKLSNYLESQGHKVICSDIHDYDMGHEIKNFYKFTERKADHMITNPPFNVSEMFIKKSIELDIKVFCLLLKSTYWHAVSRLELFNSYRPSYILPLTWRPDFKGLGAPTMDFSWNVWFDFDRQTKYKLLKKPS